MFENKQFFQRMDKSGKKRTQNVRRSMLKLLTAYLHCTKDHLAPHLVRRMNNISPPNGPERVAKLDMKLMEECWLNTSVFKGHSLRGAAATCSLRLRVCYALVQAHGFWSSAQTLDQY